MFLRRIFDRIESTPMTLQGWLIGFLGISFIRVFLENFSSESTSGVITSDLPTLVHYTLFYLPTLLVLVLIVHIFSKKGVTTVSKVVLFGFLIVWTPPLVDLITSNGEGRQIAYLFTSASGLVSNFLTFFGTHTLPGITLGIRLEILTVLTLIGVYVWMYTRSVLRSVGAIITSYGALFVLLALPSFIGVHGTYEWLGLVKNSLLGQNFFHPSVAFTPLFVRSFEMYFNGVMSQVLYLITIVLLLALSFRWNAEKVKAIFRNARPERVLHYALMILLGMWLAFYEGFVFLPFPSWLDVVTLLILFISFYSAWVFAVGTNDIVDQESDRLSNKNRPLVTGVLEVSDVERSNYIFFILAVLGGYLAGHYALFMVLTFTALYYVYSMPPLHLKRFALLNSFIISLVAVSVVLGGFFTVSDDSRFSAFPFEWVLLIVAVYTLLANVKDIKDIKGDASVGVYTIPVLLGSKRGKQVIGLLVALALALIPLISGLSELWYPFVPFALGAYYLIVREPFVEKQLFRFYFLYIFVCLIALVLF